MKTFNYNKNIRQYNTRGWKNPPYQYVVTSTFGSEEDWKETKRIKFYSRVPQIFLKVPERLRSMYDTGTVNAGHLWLSESHAPCLDRSHLFRKHSGDLIALLKCNCSRVEV